MAKQAEDKTHGRTNKAGRRVMTSFSVVRILGNRKRGLAGREGWSNPTVNWLVGEGGADGGWDGWDCGFWTPKLQPDSLPRRYSFQGWGRSPASKPLRVASAATKGELLGRGPPSPGPPSHLFGPASCSNSPGQPFLIGGHVLLAALVSERPKHGGSSPGYFAVQM